MGRSAAVLLLTLVLGAFAAARADDRKRRNDYPFEQEPYEKQCSLGKPWHYSTYGCPTCTRDYYKCIETKCSDYDGKADVTINLKCLFGGKIKFAAVSYYDGEDNVCYNNVKVNKWGKSYADEIVLPKLECKELKNNRVELRFIVQDKWWYNPSGKDLESVDCCYNKCTQGKPCHTCEFKKIYIPECKTDCKKLMCDPKKPECPPKIDDCFEYVPYYNYVKVKFNTKCHEKMKHVACSYHDKGKGKSIYHEYTDKDRYFSFDAPCKSEIKYYFEDDYYRNKDAPKCPSKDDDYCYPYFKDGKVCDQCGPYKIKVPKCLEGDY